MAKKDGAQAEGPKDAKDVTKEAKKPAAAKKADESQSSFSAMGFVQSTKEELDKVVWPSRQQLISESVAVILMVTLSATLIYLIDGLFRWAAGQPWLFGG